MAMLTNEDVTWYVATRKGTGAHFLLNEYYIENYEQEFMRIREFDSIEEAKAALDAREEADRLKKVKELPKKKIRASKVRGDIRKGSLEEETFEQNLVELQEEVVAQIEAPKKTSTRTTRPTKEKLE